MNGLRVERRTLATVLALVVLTAGAVLSGMDRAGAADRGGGNGAAHGHAKNFDYVAMWQNIDVEDGAPSLISITPGPERGDYQIALKADFFTICGTESGQGYATGTAEVVDGALLSQDWEIFCEGAATISVPARFAPDRANDLLIMTLVGVDRPAFVSHRMSTEDRGR